MEAALLGWGRGEKLYGGCGESEGMDGRGGLSCRPPKRHTNRPPKNQTASDTGLSRHPALVQALVEELMPEARRLYEGALAAALSSMTSQQGWVWVWW